MSAAAPNLVSAGRVGTHHFHELEQEHRARLRHDSDELDHLKENINVKTSMRAFGLGAQEGHGQSLSNLRMLCALQDLDLLEEETQQRQGHVD